MFDEKYIVTEGDKEKVLGMLISSMLICGWQSIRDWIIDFQPNWTQRLVDRTPTLRVDTTFMALAMMVLTSIPPGAAVVSRVLAATTHPVRYFPSTCALFDVMWLNHAYYIIYDTVSSECRSFASRHLHSWQHVYVQGHALLLRPVSRIFQQHVWSLRLPHPRWRMLRQSFRGMHRDRRPEHQIQDQEWSYS